MVLSATTNQNGLVQRVERATGRPYGSSGDELREIINDINEAVDDVAFLQLSKNDQLRWDDNNHTDKPTAKLNMVANQNDYKITTDDNSVDVYNILFVRVLRASGDTKYVDLKKILANDKRVPEILNPDTAVTGQPEGYLELGNKLFLDILPESSITSGIEVGFSREQSRFTVTGTSGDDSTEPGFPALFHPLIWMLAAQKWLEVNKPEDTTRLRLLEGQILQKKKELGVFVDLRNRTKNVMSNKKILYI